MEITRKGVEIKFTEEELETLKQAQKILMELEGEDEDVLELIEKKYEDYVFIPNENPLITTIDMIGALICEEE